AEFNGTATGVGALVFSGQSSLGVGNYGLKGNVQTQLSIGSILLLTPLLNPGTPITNVTIDKMNVFASSAEIDNTCGLYLTQSYLGPGQLLLNGGTLGLTGSSVVADSVSMAGASTVTIDATSQGLQCNGTFGISGAGVVNTSSTLVVGALQMNAAGSINVANGGGLFVNGTAVTISAGTLTVAAGGVYGSNGNPNLVTTIQNTGVFRPNGGETLGDTS